MNKNKWIFRLKNYEKSVKNLNNSINYISQKEPSELEKQGIIKGFELTFELGWNLIKDYLYWQGNNEITGSRDAIKEGFKTGLISNGEVWLDMISFRNLSAHIYDDKIADSVIYKIKRDFIVAFKELLDKMDKIKNKEGL